VKEGTNFMPEQSNAPANPLDNGAPINAAPTKTFYPITDADKQQAQENLRTTIARTIRQLNLSEDE